MSTSVEIGRKADRDEAAPGARSGSGPLRTPRIRRPRNSGQAAASGPARWTGDRAREEAGHRRLVERLQLAEAGRREIAGDARTPRQSARFGVTLMSSTGVAEPGGLGEGTADRRPRGFELDDVVLREVVPRCRATQAEHSIAVGRLATDRARLQQPSPLRGMSVPTAAKTPEHCPARALGAPAHHLDLAPAGVDDADPQPVGIGMGLGRDEPAPTVKGARSFARSSTPSMSWPEHDEGARPPGRPAPRSPDGPSNQPSVVLHRARPSDHLRAPRAAGKPVVPEPPEVALVERSGGRGMPLFQHGDALGSPCRRRSPGTPAGSTPQLASTLDAACRSRGSRATSARRRPIRRPAPSVRRAADVDLGATAR